MFRLLAIVLGALASAADAQSPVVLDANGNVLGWYGGNFNGEVRVILPSGYTIGINGLSGSVSSGGQYIGPDGGGGSDSPNYTTTDCTGDTYFTIGAGMGKFIFVVLNLPAVYYVPPRATIGEPVQMNMRSRLEINQVCQQINETNFFYRLMPNDPAETGWDRGLQVPGPLKLGIQTVPALPFSDGFENPQAALATSRVTGIA